MNQRKRWIVSCIWLTSVFHLCLLALILTGAGSATAGDKSVLEQILTILRSNGQITEKQYNDLLEQAKAEERKAEEGKPDRDTFTVFWKDGLNLESKDKQFKLKIGGRVHTDFAGFDGDDKLEERLSEDLDESGAEVRRARLYMEGTIHEFLEFKTELDFANSEVALKDVYVGARDIPVIGHTRVGHMKEPFSLEEITGSNDTTFMERGLPNVFAPLYNVGIMFDNSELDSRITWGVGGFRETDNGGFGFGEKEGWNVSTRVTGLPWYSNEGRRLLHLGFSYSHKFRDEGDDDTVRFQQRPEAHLSPVRFVDTGDIPTGGVNLINPEAALVIGPFSIQGEYFHAFVSSDPLDDPDFNGFYVFASYFLTGENRPYKTSRGAFERVRPKQDFNIKHGGYGAWEFAVRYSKIDLNEGSITGGELDDITAGLNWYLNPNVKIMLNYVRAMLEDRQLEDGTEVDGDANIFESRFQVAF